MLEALIVIAIFAIWGYQESENTVQVLFFMILFAASVIGAGMAYDREYRTKPHTDLPEEWKAISQDSTMPDTVTALLRNDTVFIQFIPIAKKEQP